MSKRYQLVQQNPDTKLWRVQALVDIRPNVAKGDIGGWVEGEHNLSQDITSTAWVYEEAQVSGEAQVYGKARVWGEAQVYGKAQVWGKAHVWGQAQVRGEAQVCGQAQVWGQAQVRGEARVYGQAQVSGEAWVFGQARVQKVCLHIQQPRHSMTATDTHLIIGCQAHTWDTWLGRGFIDKLGREYEYTQAEIREARAQIRLLHKQVQRLTTN